MTHPRYPILHAREHLEDGSDPIPGIGNIPNPDSGDTVPGLILALGPDAFWKLDELTGTTAHDSSGNGHHMEPPTPTFQPPTWGEAVGPTGLTSALWPVGSDPLGLTPEYREHVSSGMTSYTDNFTAGVWFNALTNQGNDHLFGQGNPNATWGFFFVSGGSLQAGVLTDPCSSTATLSYGTWYFAALVRDSGTWKLYVNGILQSDTSTAVPSAASDTWFGVNTSLASGGGAGYAEDVLMSCGFIVNHVVSGTELLAIYEAGATGGTIAAGKVWTALGDGTANWDWPTEVEF